MPRRAQVHVSGASRRTSQYISTRAPYSSGRTQQVELLLPFFFASHYPSPLHAILCRRSPSFSSTYHPSPLLTIVRHYAPYLGADYCNHPLLLLAILHRCSRSFAAAPDPLPLSAVVRCLRCLRCFSLSFTTCDPSPLLAIYRRCLRSFHAARDRSPLLTMFPRS